MKYFLIILVVGSIGFPSFALGDLSIPAKKRIYQGKNRTFKRNPVYPWSLSDLNSKYGKSEHYELPKQLPEGTKLEQKRLDQMDDSEEILDDPVLEPFVN